jgi:hypothetical protein
MSGIAPFIEVLRDDVFSKQVRIGHWIYTRDAETGEGSWKWTGKSVPEIWYEKHPQSPLTSRLNLGGF